MKEWNSFTERLHFVDYEGRIFAVMAYSAEDAWRQVRESHFMAFMVGLSIHGMLYGGIHERRGWTGIPRTTVPHA